MRRPVNLCGAVAESLGFHGSDFYCCRATTITMGFVGRGSSWLSPDYTAGSLNAPSCFWPCPWCSRWCSSLSSPWSTFSGSADSAPTPWLRGTHRINAEPGVRVGMGLSLSTTAMVARRTVKKIRRAGRGWRTGDRDRTFVSLAIGYLAFCTRPTFCGGWAQVLRSSWWAAATPEFAWR